MFGTFLKPRHVQRVATFLLLPCLVADPALAASWSQGLFPVIQTSLGLRNYQSPIFKEQALESSALWMRKNLGNTQIASRVRVIAAGTMAALALGTFIAHPHISDATVLQRTLWLVGVASWGWLSRTFGIRFVPGALTVNMPKDQPQSITSGNRVLDLRQILQEEIERLKTYSARYAVTVQSDLPKEPLWIEDHDRLPEGEMIGSGVLRDRIVYEVLVNAIKYSEPGGIVRVSLRSNKTEAVLVISDQGIGIDQNDLKRIWQWGFRAANAKKKSGGGGAGLALVHEAVDDYQGAIQVESQLNVGTVVTIRLPIGQLIRNEIRPVAMPVPEAEGAERRVRHLESIITESTSELVDSLAYQEHLIQFWDEVLGLLQEQGLFKDATLIYGVGGADVIPARHIDTIILDTSKAGKQHAVQRFGRFEDFKHRLIYLEGRDAADPTNINEALSHIRTPRKIFLLKGASRHLRGKSTQVAFINSIMEVMKPGDRILIANHQDVDMAMPYFNQGYREIKDWIAPPYLERITAAITTMQHRDGRDTSYAWIDDTVFEAPTHLLILEKDSPAETTLVDELWRSLSFHKTTHLVDPQSQLMELGWHIFIKSPINAQTYQDLLNEIEPLVVSATTDDDTQRNIRATIAHAVWNTHQHGSDSCALLVRIQKEQGLAELIVLDRGYGFVDRNGKHIPIDQAAVGGQSFGRGGTYGAGLRSQMAYSDEADVTTFLQESGITRGYKWKKGDLNESPWIGNPVIDHGTKFVSRINLVPAQNSASNERLKAKALKRKGYPYYKNPPPTTGQTITHIQKTLKTLELKGVSAVLFGSFGDGRYSRWSDLDYFLIPTDSNADIRHWGDVQSRFQGLVHAPLGDNEEGYFIEEPGPFDNSQATPESIGRHIEAIWKSGEQRQIWIISEDDARAIPLQEGSLLRDIHSILDEVPAYVPLNTKVTSIAEASKNSQIRLNPSDLREWLDRVLFGPAVEPHTPNPHVLGAT